MKGLTADGRIPGLDHERAKVDADGIGAADVVLVPLEDGDRAEALGEMGKTELVIDLNPRSRSAEVATVPIIDNIIRAIPNITEHARDLRGDPDAQQDAIDTFDADSARPTLSGRFGRATSNGLPPYISPTAGYPTRKPSEKPLTSGR